MATYFARETFRDDVVETRPREERFVQKARTEQEREPQPTA